MLSCIYCALEQSPHPHAGSDRRKEAQPFFHALNSLLRRPQQILFSWNWKSALLSVILRGPIFLVAGARQGWRGSLAALLTESVFCAVTAGFYGAVVQLLRNAEPEWLTLLFLTTVLPAVFQALEYGMHWLRGTPHLRLAEIVSVVVSGVSALFNFYAMRRGTLLVGGEGGSFGSDLRRLPRLLLGFLVALPRRVALRRKPRSQKRMSQVAIPEIADGRPTCP